MILDFVEAAYSQTDENKIWWCNMVEAVHEENAYPIVYLSTGTAKPLIFHLSQMEQ